MKSKKSKIEKLNNTLRNLGVHEKYDISLEELNSILFNDTRFGKELALIEKLYAMDLSKVSFDDVKWNLPTSKFVDLGNTNVNIDFSKGKIGNKKRLCGYGFYNVDLSNSNLNYFNEVNETILTNTNIKYDDIKNIKFTSTYLDDNDINIDMDLVKEKGRIFLKKDNLKIYSGCNINNTKINIVTDDLYLLDKFCKEEIIEDALKGCYLNGEVPNPEEIYKKLYIDYDFKVNKGYSKKKSHE